MSSSRGLRALALLIGLMMIASACAASNTPAEGVAEMAQAVASQAAIPTPQPIVEVPADGRVALASAEGQAHILWFWGAN